LTGELDAFARVLYFVALFLTILLLTQVNYFAKLQFFLSWWAYSFPLAAITIATLRMYEMTSKQGFYYMGWGFLVLISTVVLFLLYKTIRAISRHNICVRFVIRTPAPPSPRTAGARQAPGHRRDNR